MKNCLENYGKSIRKLYEGKKIDYLNLIGKKWTTFGKFLENVWEDHNRSDRHWNSGRRRECTSVFNLLLFLEKAHV